MKSNGKSFGKFMLLWAGGFVSAIGGGLTSFGLGVYVYQQTGLASAASLVMLLAFLPTILLSAPAGVLADRYDRRLLMVLGDGLSALGLLFILACMARGEASLWQICAGVFISSVFSALLQPAYKATISDLLTEEQYTKASGLVEISGSARYLISPVLAGFLLSVSDIRLLLIIDIATLGVTILATLAVQRGLSSRSGSAAQPTSMLRAFRDGWHVITQNKGVFALAWLTSVMTFCLGFIQTLCSPLFLAFSDSATLGVMETVAASGMLVTSVILGAIGIQKNYVRWLSTSLFFAGFFMFFFGLRESIWLITLSGFLFFAMLPLANATLDYLRTNVENAYQGRVWGLVGVISQLGYVLAYAISGLLADYVFTPLLLPGGALAASVGRITGVGAGRGIGLLIMVAGLLLCLAAICLYRVKSIRALEHKGAAHIS